MTGPLIDLERGERRREMPALVEALAQRVVMLEAALRACVEVAKAWHNMPIQRIVPANDVWDIYYKNAPEMKPIREALANAQKREGPSPP